MKVVGETEIEDFETALRESGRNVGDFEVKEDDETQFSSNSIVPITGKVTITNKKTNRACTYQAGNGTAWVYEFQKDLRSGKFD